MNIARARSTDPPIIAEAIVRKLSPYEWLKILVFVGGFVVGAFVLRAQNEERWNNQHDRDISQDRKQEENKADLTARLNRMEDLQIQTLKALGVRDEAPDRGRRR